MNVHFIGKLIAIPFPKIKAAYFTFQPTFIFLAIMINASNSSLRISFDRVYGYFLLCTLKKRTGFFFIYFFRQAIFNKRFSMLALFLDCFKYCRQ